MIPVLLCQLFAAFQAMDNLNHPTPFLYKVTIQLCDAVATSTLIDRVQEEPAEHLSFAVIVSLDTIFMNIAKESMDPTKISLACSDKWITSPSCRFKTAQTALTLCLNQLEMVATGVMVLPTMPLYNNSNLKCKRNDTSNQAMTKNISSCTLQIFTEGHTLGHTTITTTVPPAEIISTATPLHHPAQGT